MIEANADAGEFEVWADNWEAISAFQCVSTQWRAIGMMAGGVYWQGLDYSGVTAGLAGAGIDASPDLWAQLRVIEGAARNCLNGMAERD